MAKQPEAVLQHSAELRNSLLIPPSLTQDDPQAVAGPEGIGVVGAEQPHKVVEHRTELNHGFLHPARLTQETSQGRDGSSA